LQWSGINIDKLHRHHSTSTSYGEESEERPKKGQAKQQEKEQTRRQKLAC